MVLASEVRVRARAGAIAVSAVALCCVLAAVIPRGRVAPNSVESPDDLLSGWGTPLSSWWEDVFSAPSAAPPPSAAPSSPTSALHSLSRLEQRLGTAAVASDEASRRLDLVKTQLDEDRLRHTSQLAEGGGRARNSFEGSFWKGIGAASKVPDIDTLGSPSLVRDTDTVDFDSAAFDRLGLHDHFAARWRGEVAIKAAGSYTFYSTSDDGSKLYVNNDLVVDNDGLHGPETKTGTVELEAGRYPVTATFFERGGGSLHPCLLLPRPSLPLSTSRNYMRTHRTNPARYRFAQGQYAPALRGAG